MYKLTDREIEEKIPAHILGIIERYRLFDEEAYIVGGSLRDIMLGLEPHDFDLASSALPSRTSELFSDGRVIGTGLKHGTVTVLVENTPVEITTFRIDGSYTDSRHPDGVLFTRSIEEDLSRRDFTVNAMAFAPRVGLVDPFSGRADLEKKILRAVGDPQKRFGEDALRIMRAFRFSAQLGFDIESETLGGAKQCREGLKNIAKERICSEFLRLLSSDGAAHALELMIENGILPFVTGDYTPSEKIISDLQKMPRDQIARLGFFLCEAEREEAARIISTLKCSNKQRVGALAVGRGAHISVATEADARRFIGNVGDYARSAICASVLLGNSPEAAIEWVEKNNSPCTLAQLAISGRELSEIGFSGKEIGNTLEFLLCAVIDDPKLNVREALIDLAKKIKEE